MDKKSECKEVYPRVSKKLPPSRIRPYEALTDTVNWKKGDLILLPAFFVFASNSRKAKNNE